MRSSVGRGAKEAAAGACGTRTCDAAIEGAAQRAKTTTGKMSRVSVDNRIFRAWVKKRLLENHSDRDNDDRRINDAHARAVSRSVSNLRKGTFN